jgi:hypothetical protein
MLLLILFVVLNGQNFPESYIQLSDWSRDFQPANSIELLETYSVSSLINCGFGKNKQFYVFKNRLCIILCSSMQRQYSMSHIRLRLLITCLSSVRRCFRYGPSHSGSTNCTCWFFRILSNILQRLSSTLCTMCRKSIFDMAEQHVSLSTSFILEWKCMWKSTIWKCIVYEWRMVPQWSIWTYLFRVKCLHT